MKAREDYRERGTGSIFKRGHKLWIRYYRNGEGFSESTGGDNMTEARAKLKKRLAELETGTFNPDAGKTSIGDLYALVLADYEQQKQRSIDHVHFRWEGHLRNEFENMPASSLTTDRLNAYVSRRLADGAKPATINRELALLKRGYSLAMKHTPPKVKSIPYFPHLEEDNIRTGLPEEAEVDKISSNCSQVGLWMVALFTVLSEYGCRVGELLNLRVHQIELESKVIRLDPGTTKNGRGRIAPMTSRVHSLLSECVFRKDPADYVFTRPNGNPVVDFRGTWEAVIADVKPDLLVHDMRRYAVRRMIRRGIPEKVAMMISGHRTRSVFDRYDIITESDLHEAAKKLEPTPSATIEIQSPVSQAPSRVM